MNKTNNSQRKKDVTLMGEASWDTKDEGGSKRPSERLESGHHADTNNKKPKEEEA